MRACIICYAANPKYYVGVKDVGTDSQLCLVDRSYSPWNYLWDYNPLNGLLTLQSRNSLVATAVGQNKDIVLKEKSSDFFGQQWTIIGSTNTQIQNRSFSDMVMDDYHRVAKSGNRIWLYKNNSTIAQLWSLQYVSSAQLNELETETMA